MKKSQVFLFINLILLIFLPINTRVFAKEASIDNIDLIITYNNTIDHNVERLITSLGGQVISEIPELGTSEVKCSVSDGTNDVMKNNLPFDILL